MNPHHKSFMEKHDILLLLFFFFFFSVTETISGISFEVQWFVCPNRNYYNNLLLLVSIMASDLCKWKMLSVMLVLGFVAWKYSCGLELTSWTSERCKSCGSGLTQYLANARKLGNRKSSEGLSFFRPSHGTNLAIMLILAGDIEVNLGPRFQCGV